jgi:hypothetical protein
VDTRDASGLLAGLPTRPATPQVPTPARGTQCCHLGRPPDLRRPPPVEERKRIEEALEAVAKEARTLDASGRANAALRAAALLAVKLGRVLRAQRGSKRLLAALLKVARARRVVESVDGERRLSGRPFCCGGLGPERWLRSTNL